MLSGAVRLARHGGFHCCFQLLTRIFHSVLEVHVIGIRVINSSLFSCIVGLRHFNSPMSCSLFFESLETYFTTLFARNDPMWILLELQSSLPGPRVSVWDPSFDIEDFQEHPHKFLSKRSTGSSTLCPVLSHL